MCRGDVLRKGTQIPSFKVSDLMMFQKLAEPGPLSLLESTMSVLWCFMSRI